MNERHADHVLICRVMAQPVVDVARRQGESNAQNARFVTIEVGGRRIALAAGQVLGTRALAHGESQGLPPVQRRAGRETVAALDELDAKLLLVLESARRPPTEPRDAEPQELRA